MVPSIPFSGDEKKAARRYMQSCGLRRTQHARLRSYRLYSRAGDYRDPGSSDFRARVMVRGILSGGAVVEAPCVLGVDCNNCHVHGADRRDVRDGTLAVKLVAPGAERRPKG